MGRCDEHLVAGAALVLGGCEFRPGARKGGSREGMRQGRGDPGRSVPRMSARGSHPDLPTSAGEFLSVTLVDAHRTKCLLEPRPNVSGRKILLLASALPQELPSHYRARSQSACVATGFTAPQCSQTLIALSRLSGLQPTELLHADQTPIGSTSRRHQVPQFLQVHLTGLARDITVALQAAIEIPAPDSSRCHQAAPRRTGIMNLMSTGIIGSEPTVLATLTSQRQVRDINAGTVLGLLWDALDDSPITASELVDATNMTRPTVLSICDELRDQGWLLEDRTHVSGGGRGRKARRFVFNRRRHYIAAGDVSFRLVSAVVTDLKGTILGRAETPISDDPLHVDRTRILIETLGEALRLAEIEPDQVSTVSSGIAAPVTHRGTPYPSDPPNPLWENMVIDKLRLQSVFHVAQIWVENDADLAAVAELHARRGANPNPMIALLATEYLGAGTVINGQLLRGSNGGAGEMGYLQYFIATTDGVPSPLGTLGLVGSVNTLVDAAIQSNRPSSLWSLDHKEDPRPRPRLGDIIGAAGHGDPLAREFTDQIVDHLTAAILPLADIIDPALVVISGGSASEAAPLIPSISRKLADLIPFPPTIEVSTIGRDVVLVGAIRSAILQSQINALSS